MSEPVNPLSLVSGSALRSQAGDEGSQWFEAMAEAWGKTLDNKAAQIEGLADQIGGGDNSPGTITKLQAQSLEMSFLAQSSHTAISSVGSALETMARKQ
jgi:hypothetical protein